MHFISIFFSVVPILIQHVTIYECHYRRAGFIYQYFDAVAQDLEGSLEIVTTQMGNIETTSVDSGLCQDFFEFRMVSSHYAQSAFTCTT